MLYSDGGTTMTFSPTAQLRLVLLLVVTGFLMVSSVVQAGAQTAISSPYEEVNWDQVVYHKAALHVHTTESDGAHSPADSIRAHRELGFDVLGITDHASHEPHETTWPWEEYPVFDEKPQWVHRHDGIERSAYYKNTELVAINSAEIDTHNHVISLFSNAAYPGSEISKALDMIGDKDGYSWFAHPSWHDRGNQPEYYISYFDRYPSMNGLEVGNTHAGDSYDTHLWDELLSHYGTDRPVHGLVVSDDHTSGKREKNGGWIYVLASPSPEPGTIHRAIENARTFWVINGHSPMEDFDVRVRSLRTKERSIHLDVTGEYREIRWMHEGKQVEEGTTFTYEAQQSNPEYIRFEIWVDGDLSNIEEANVLGSQPFYFADRDE